MEEQEDPPSQDVTPSQDLTHPLILIPEEFVDNLQATIWYSRGAADGLAGKPEQDLQDLSEPAAAAYRRGYKYGQERQSPPGKVYEYRPKK